MEERLKDLKSIMDRHIYRKQRFSSSHKNLVLTKIRQIENKGRPPVLLKDFLSVAVCLCLLISFSIYVVNFSDNEQNALQHSITEEDLTLPFLNSVVLPQLQDRGLAQNVSFVFKDEHVIALELLVKDNMQDKDYKKNTESVISVINELHKKVYMGNEDLLDKYELWIYISTQENGMISDFVLKGNRHKGSQRILWSNNIDEGTYRQDFGDHYNH